MYKNNDFFMIVTRQWKKICNFARKLIALVKLGIKFPLRSYAKFCAKN